MKISLINPPFLFPDKVEIVYSQSLGLRYLSSFLRTNGDHKIHFIDGLMLGFSNVKRYANGYIVGLNIEEIVARVPRDTELIGISVPFSQIAPLAHNLTAHVKTRFPDAMIVMGGVYPSTQPQLALTSKADLIVVGEGECALKEIADGKKHQEIEGVYSRNSLENESFPAAKRIENLDSIPFPDYSIPLMDQYFNISPRMRRGRTAALVTSRGCPFACEFCSIHPVNGRKYRYRSADNVLDEIKYLVERHAIKSLEIEDDNFTLRKDRTVDILEGIICLNERGVNLNWRTPNGVRIDTLDEEMVKLINKSNCTEIVLALEHGDPEMLQIMNKKLDLDKTLNVLELLVKHNIKKITLFVIVGYPGETQKRFLNSLDYLKRIRKLGRNISICVNIAQPYPGTKLLERCKTEGYTTDKNFDNFLIRRDIMSTGKAVFITTADFDCQEVLHRKKLLMKCFGVSWKTTVKRFTPVKIINLARKLLRR